MFFLSVGKFYEPLALPGAKIKTDMGSGHALATECDRVIGASEKEARWPAGRENTFLLIRRGE